MIKKPQKKLFSTIDILNPSEAIKGLKIAIKIYGTDQSNLGNQNVSTDQLWAQNIISGQRRVPQLVLI